VDLAHVDLTEGAGLQAAILTAVAGNECPFAALRIWSGAGLATAMGAGGGRLRGRSRGRSRRAQKARNKGLGGQLNGCLHVESGELFCGCHY